jgi:hypothetical protein
MLDAIKTIYRAVLKEKCLIATHESPKGLIVVLWDPTGQHKRYIYCINEFGIETLAKRGARWDEGHPSGSFSLITRSPGVY